MKRSSYQNIFLVLVLMAITSSCCGQPLLQDSCLLIQGKIDEFRSTRLNATPDIFVGISSKSENLYALDTGVLLDIRKSDSIILAFIRSGDTLQVYSNLGTLTKTIGDKIVSKDLLGTVLRSDEGDHVLYFTMIIGKNIMSREQIAQHILRKCK